jgi:hypothetical protein
MSKAVELKNFSINISQPLSTEDREEARVISGRVWSKGFQMLNGKQHLPLIPMDPECQQIEIFQLNNHDPKRNPDLNIRKKIAKFGAGSDGEILFVIELFSFRREYGGYVVKATYLQSARGETVGAIEAHESGKEELEKLFDCLKYCRTIEEGV